MKRVILWSMHPLKLETKRSHFMCRWITSAGKIVLIDWIISWYSNPKRKVPICSIFLCCPGRSKFCAQWRDLSTNKEQKSLNFSLIQFWQTILSTGKLVWCGAWYDWCGWKTRGPALILLNVHISNVLEWSLIYTSKKFCQWL